MSDQMFKEQQKQQTPIQITREEEKLKLSGEQPLLQQQQQEQQEQTTAERQMTMASEQILNSEKFAREDGSDPANPPMDFTDEQLREWYDRKKAAQVNSQL